MKQKGIGAATAAMVPGRGVGFSRVVVGGDGGGGSFGGSLVASGQTEEITR